MIQNYQTNLFKLLNAYSSQLEELIELLHEEHNILQLRDVVALEECTQRKQDMLETLANLGREKDALEKEYEISTNEGIENNSKLSALKTHIRQLLQKTKDQNDINGSIIDVSRQFGQQILDIMFGKSSENKTYDADGKDSRTTTGHTLAKI